MSEARVGSNGRRWRWSITSAAGETHPNLMAQGLPLRMMLIARSGQDAMVLRAAHAFERIPM